LTRHRRSTSNRIPRWPRSKVRSSGARASRARATRRILLVVGPGTELLDLAGPLQVFKTAQLIHGELHPHSAPCYRVETVALATRPGFTTNTGIAMRADRTFSRVRGAVDTCLIAGGTAIEEDRTSRQTLDWIRALAPRIRRLGAVCTGTFFLARAGLLDGRRATTHWNWCQRLAQRHPDVMVDPDPIFVRDQFIYTSAGVTAGMDLALALVEEDVGAAVALAVARQLVLYLRRPGGQSQFSAALSMQLGDRKAFHELETWVLGHLSDKLDVQTLAARVAMSPRNFARVFHREMQTTPAKFVERLRVEVARRRLEETRYPLKRIAAECGFRALGSFRDVFQRVVGVSPARYRTHFRKHA
jgi:transcriptional regulator GlxA family with amidase domain